MRNSNCKICFKEFKAREGKLYCSNACKQRGFMDKKIVPIKIKEDQAVEKPKKRKFEFYLSDFEEYIEKFPNTFDSILVFSFFRKNMEGVFNPDQFQKYVNSFSTEFWEEFWGDDESPAKRKYKEFEALYFSDDVSIHFPGNNKKHD